MEVDGRRMGPFTTEQVLGLLQDGEIRAETRITSPSMQGKWITVRELAGQGKSATFQPPPRPAELAQHASGSESADRPPEHAPGTTDPALSLFDTLKAAKDKQSARAAIPPPMETARSGSGISGRLSPRAWLGAVIVLALLGSIWAMVRYIKAKALPLSPPPEAIMPPPPPPGAPPIQPMAPQHEYSPPVTARGGLNGPVYAVPPPSMVPLGAAIPPPPLGAAPPPPPPPPADVAREQDYNNTPSAAEGAAPILAPAPPPAPPPPIPPPGMISGGGNEPAEANQVDTPPPPAPPPLPANQ